jgi:hypothetical protein
MNKFQQFIISILEDTSVGDGALGIPETPIYNPPGDIKSGDKYAPGDNRNIFGLGIYRRNFPETITGKKRKYKIKKRRKKK